MSRHIIFSVLSCLAVTLYVWGAYSLDVGCDVAKRHEGNLRVVCRQKHMTSLPSQWPPGCIVSLRAKRTSLYNISSLGHPQMVCLEKLNLDDNLLREVPASALSGLTMLSSLNLDRNLLKQVPTEAFRRLSSLKTLSLRFNSLETISNWAFQGLGRLRSLCLDFNFISVISARAFGGLSSLTFLSMTHNSLVYRGLPSGLFAAATDLQSLHLEHNDNDEQGEYPRHVFNALPRLRILSIDTFSSVHFGTDFAAMTEIYDLDLSHNCSLTRLGNDSFEGFRNSSLRNIRLNFCPLHFVDTCAFCDLPRLQWISMSPGRLMPKKMAAKKLYELRQNIVYNVDLVHSWAPANRPSFAAHQDDFAVITCSAKWDLPSTVFDFFCVPVKTPRDANPYIIDIFKRLASNTSELNSTGNGEEEEEEELILDNVNVTCGSQSVRTRVKRRFPLYVLGREVSEHGLQKPAWLIIQKCEHLAEVQLRLPPSTLHIQVDPLWKELTLSQYFSEAFPQSGVYFHSVSNLRHLDMSHWNSSVCHGPFHGLENLISFDMSGGSCFDIVDTMWDHLPSLQYLNFSSMALNNRQFIRVSHRLFKGMSQLKYLDLSDNALRFFSLSAFHGMRNLKKLILSNNLISSLDGLDPESTPNLSVLDLSFNNIRYFTDHEMRKLDDFGNSRNFSLFVQGNDFLCSCDTVVFISWMHEPTLKITFNNADVSKPKPLYLNYTCTTDWGEAMTVSQFYYEYGPFCENQQDSTKAAKGRWSYSYSCCYLGPWLKTFLESLGVIAFVLCFALWHYLKKNVLDTFFQDSELGRSGVKTYVHDPANSYIKGSDIMKHPHTKKHSRQTVRGDQNTNACASRTSRVQQEKASQDDAGPHYPPIVCDKWRTSASVGVDGDVLRMTRSDVILHIPPYAVNGNITMDIQSAVCANTEHVHSVMSLSAEEEVVSPLAEYWAGMNFVFKRLVCIVLPHCLPPHPDLDQVKVYRISRDDDGRANVTQLPRRELNIQGNASDLLEDVPFYQLRDDGTVLVYTDHFSAYVCVYCGLRQGPVTLKAMVCGTHHQKPSGQHAVYISVHIWDRRLNIRDFREEYGVGDQGVELASMAVNLLESTEGSNLCLRVETSGQEADQWQPSRRSDGRPTTALVQQHPFSSVVTCDNVDCDQRRLWIRPVTSHWTMESRAGSRPGAWLQCVVDISHVTAADDTPQWIDRLGRERVTTRPFLCCMETGPETAVVAPDPGDRRRYGERHLATLSVLSNSSRPHGQEPYPLGSMSECPNNHSQAPVACVTAPLPTSPPAAGTVPMISMNQARYVLATAQRASPDVKQPYLQFPSSTQFQDSPRGENEHHPSPPFPLKSQLHDSPRGENVGQPSPDNVGQPSPQFHPRTQFQDSRGREKEQGPSRPGAGCSRHQPGTLDNDDDLRTLGASGGFPSLWSVPNAGFADLNPHPLGSYGGFACPRLLSMQHSGLEFAEGGARGSSQLQRLEQPSSHRQHSLATHFGPAPAAPRGENGSEQHATQRSDNTTYHVHSVQSAQLAGSGHDDQQRLNMLSPRATHRVSNDSAVHMNAQTLEALCREFQIHCTTSQLPHQAPVPCGSDGDQLLDVDNPSDGSM